MNILVSIVVYYGLALFSGWSILSWVGAADSRERMGPVPMCALAYGLGMGAVSLEAFLYLLYGFKITVVRLFVPWVFLTLYAMAKNPPVRLPKATRAPREALSRLEIFLVCGICFEVAYAFFRAVLYPMEAYDAVGIWAIKSKAIYLAGALPVDLFKNVGFAYAHFDYPLLIPMQEAVFYFVSGGMDDALVKALFPAYLAAFCILFYALLKRLCGDRKKALLFTFLLGTIPQFKEYATNGYADFVVSFYYTMGFLFLYMWSLEEKKEFLLLSGLASAMCAWTKNEGYILCLLNLSMACAIVWTKRASPGDGRSRADMSLGLGFYVLAIAVFIFPWEAFKSSIGIKSDLLVKEVFSIERTFRNLARLGAIAYEYQKQFFGFKKWNLAWVFFIALFLVNFKKAFSGRFLWITVSVLGALCIYTFVYIVTPKDFGWHLSTTASRLFIHIAPLAIFWLAMMAKELRLEL